MLRAVINCYFIKSYFFPILTSCNLSKFFLILLTFNILKNYGQTIQNNNNHCNYYYDFN